jgi:hypothetical protein
MVGLAQDEKGKDLALLVYGDDKPTIAKIEALFPGIPWQKRSNHWQVAAENPCLWFMEVPFDRVPQGDKGLFHVQRFPGESWRRRCYGRYGLGRGLIRWEDRAAHWNDNLPPPNFIDWNNSMRLEGDWNVKAAGDYTLSVHTANLLWFFLDGKKLLEIRPGDGMVQRSKEVHLEAGPHHLELVTAFTWEHKVPMVSVKTPGSSADVPLDELNNPTQETKP